MNLKTSVSRKQSTPNFPKSKHFLPPNTHTYVRVSGGKKCLFFGKFGVLCFLEILVLRFALLLYYRRYMHYNYLLSCLCRHKFQIKLSFLIKAFSYVNKNLEQKFKYLENEKSLKHKLKSIFHHF